MSDSTQLTYTTAQVHHRLGIPKPTIRNWSAEYAEFLSERAQPDSGKTRVFIYDDLVILNTVRHLTRVEGLNNNDLVRQALREGRRETGIPEVRTPEEAEALASVQLVPVAELERALDQVSSTQDEVDRLGQESVRVEEERDQALIALDDANQQIATLREERGRIRGMMLGVGGASIGIVLLAIASVTGLLSLVTGLLP